MTLDDQPSIRISEIFGPTIQGEGALIGQPTVFVRTGGCDFRCSWCDTLHAVDNKYRHEWQPMSARSIWNDVLRLSNNVPLVVSLSGGNPAIQPLAPLIELGKADGFRFALETQGSIAKNWFRHLDVLTLSPKPPSSGMPMDWGKLEACVAAAAGTTKIVLKIVIFDDADYRFAKQVAAQYPDLSIYLQPGNHTPPPPEDSNAFVDIDGIQTRLNWLIEKVTKDHWFSATILPQLHVLIWGNKRGV